MEKEELKALSREEVKNYITGIWKSLWDGSAGNAYVSVEVLGSTVEEVKEALVTLVKEENSEVIDMLVSDNLWLHEDCAKDDGCVRMAYWKGGIDFAYTLSKTLPDTIVICEDGGWYGIDECIIAKNGGKAVPGIDYTGVMEYSLESDSEDFEEDEDEDDEEELYFTVELRITDKKGNVTYVGGGMISQEDTEKYKSWANVIRDVYDMEKKDVFEKVKALIEMKGALTNLKSAWTRCVDAFSNIYINCNDYILGNEYALDEYPFDMSFDEINVAGWVDASLEKIVKEIENLDGN